jgi:hypothetical protein
MQVHNRSRRKTEWDEQLIAQVLLDDFEAYGILLKKYQLFINHVAYSLTGNQKEGRKLAMVAIMVLWNDRKKLHPEIPFRGYLEDLITKLHKRGSPFLSDN